jgi:cytochrome c-type biogenesis protein CcmH/NrfG
MTRNTIAQMLLVAAASLAAPSLHAQCVPAVQRLIATLKYDEARTQLEAQLKRAPSDDAAMHCMGRVLLEQDRTGDAVDWLEKAIAVNG